MRVHAAQGGGTRATSGAVELVFARPRGERTIIQRQFANYPFHICRGFNFDGDPQGMSTVYLQSLAGGIYEHDRLFLGFEVSHGAAADVETAISDGLDEARTSLEQQKRQAPQMTIRVTDVGNRTFHLRVYGEGSGSPIWGIIQNSQPALFDRRKIDVLLKPKSFFRKK